MDNNSMRIPIILLSDWSSEKKAVELKALIDCGAEDVFIDQTFAHKHRFPLTRLKKPMKVFNVDGTPNKEGRITHFTRLKLTINGKKKRTAFLVTRLGKEEVILGLPWLKKENPVIDWQEGTLEWRTDRRTEEPRPDPNEIEDELKAETKPLWIRAKTTASQTLAQKHEEVKPEVPLKEQIPKEYHDYLDVFDKKTATRFPGPRPWDHAIDLKPDFAPRRGKIYSLSPREDKELKEFLDENLAKGYIRSSTSPQASPFFFVAKKDGSLRPCQDYRQLNKATVRNAYPLPRIPDLIDKLRKAKFFTKMDVRWGYNNIRIKDGDQWKAAFITNAGLFEPTVMFFGLTNSPATFQAMMDSIFEEEIREGIAIVYMDDILVFAETLKQLEEYTRRILKKLKKHDLFLKPEKCAFARQKIDYLGFIIEEGKISMDPVKLAGLRDWPEPKTVKQVRSFLGFGNFYRKFIQNYSRIAKPLNNLLKKDVPFKWTEDAQLAFDELKRRFTKEPVLMMPDPNRPFQVESDASLYASGAVLTQMDANGKRHPVFFLSQTFTQTEQNYQIYDRELLGIMRALREWRHYLQGSPHPIMIYTDHLNLLYFKSPQKLNDRQRRWIPELAQYDFKLEHRPGTTMVQSDALSRRPDHHPSEEEESRETVLLLPERFVANIKLEADGTMFDSSLRKEIATALQSEAVKTEFPALLSEILPEHWERYPTEEGPLFLYKGKVYIPSDPLLRRKITKLYHDTPTAGHPGQQGTRLAVQRHYYWPGMTHFINRYVRGCAACQQNKINRRPTKPPLFPIEASSEPRPFAQCSMDLITDLPASKGFDSILVIIDHGLTKGAIFTPCHKTITAEQLSDILLQKLFTKYGRLNKIISDRGPQFVAGSFKEVLKRMGITGAPSTAYHPQTDGATEHVNQEIQAYLSIFCTVNPETWADRLPIAEFTHNSRTHAERQHSPFELLYGYQPPAIPTAMGESQFPAAEERLRSLEAARNEALAAHELARARMADRFPATFTPFKKGQKVWLESKNLKLPYLSKKIAPKREGPFKISDVLSPVTYRLSLPEHWRIHNVFHATLLSPFIETDTHGPAHPTPIPDIIEGEEEYEVEGILRHKKKGRKTLYLLRWKDQPTSEDSWEPEEHLTHSQELLEDYWKRFQEHSKKKEKTRRRRNVTIRTTQLAIRSTHVAKKKPSNAIRRLLLEFIKKQKAMNALGQMIINYHRNL
ncbi:hypothetical protein EST38_g5090 [Candolleomyces aberdarensis]|uniref:RNA-directed DNA polymerase n=1 Tax=Candolleomyces aberdarensis TaxID=2316362 RepID=A0A4Q2DKY3_9AGAR|nr:hypothetical protein EST38_g5090 [Candolleomyces aberdarensis]